MRFLRRVRASMSRGGMLENKSSFRWRSWETTQVRTTCPYCGVGCQQLLHVKNGKVVQVTGVDDSEPNKGSLCVKGRYGFDFIHSPERLTTPLIKENGKFRLAFVEAITGIPAKDLIDTARLYAGAALDPIAKIPEYKVCAVKLSKVA